MNHQVAFLGHNIGIDQTKHVIAGTLANHNGSIEYTLIIVEAAKHADPNTIKL